MKRSIAIICIFLFVLVSAVQCGCAEKLRFEYTTLCAFDTVTTVTAYCSGESEFKELCGIVESELIRCHRLFDIYNTYDGIFNLKSINDSAGTGPHRAPTEIMELLEYGIEMYTFSEGRLNIAMGAVLSVWHQFRESALSGAPAKLPPDDTLSAASLHCDINDLILDMSSSTVELADPEMSLDVGAVAKGYAANLIRDKLIESGYNSVLINIGGSVCVIGPRHDGDWSVGIQSSFGGYSDIVHISKGFLISSGDYQRYYEYEGARYHHIIDPDTLYPSANAASVTIRANDALLADALSTIVFIMEPKEGLSLIESIADAEALIQLSNEEILTTSGW